jgi:hypothetical protein
MVAVLPLIAMAKVQEVLSPVWIPRFTPPVAKIPAREFKPVAVLETAPTKVVGLVFAEIARLSNAPPLTRHSKVEAEIWLGT